MATIEKFCAPGVFDPATYSQGIKVSQAQTILFLSGQGPASTLVEISALAHPDWMIEIEAVAVI